MRPTRHGDRAQGNELRGGGGRGGNARRSTEIYLMSNVPENAVSSLQFGPGYWPIMQFKAIVTVFSL